MQQPNQASIVSTASTIFALVTQIKQMPRMPQIVPLKNQLLKALEEYAQRMEALAISKETTGMGKYALCALIDESILSSPWGQQSGWANQGFVLQYYQDTKAGERFFLGLNKLLESPEKNIDVLELFYTCLHLGFRGRYALVQQGEYELDKLKKKLYATIRQFKEKPSPNISTHWQGMTISLEKPIYWLPLWIMLVAFLCCTVIILSVMKASLNKLYLPEMTRVSELIYKPTYTKAIVVDKFTLTQLLKQEISQGSVTVIETEIGGTIIIKGDELFASGSSIIKPSFENTILHIAEAIKKYGGMATVAGHSDNQSVKLFSIKSNIELSRLRAKNVADLMSKYIAKNTITIIGKGEMEPLVANDTPQNRAKNRRVEIIVNRIN